MPTASEQRCLIQQMTVTGLDYRDLILSFFSLHFLWNMKKPGPKD